MNTITWTKILWKLWKIPLGNYSKLFFTLIDHSCRPHQNPSPVHSSFCNSDNIVFMLNSSHLWIQIIIWIKIKTNHIFTVKHIRGYPSLQLVLQWPWQLPMYSYGAAVLPITLKMPWWVAPEAHIREVKKGKEKNTSTQIAVGYKSFQSDTCSFLEYNFAYQ
jgi:hypothetical protein